MTQILKLNERSIITLNGADSLKFLQGLITNDVKKINDMSFTYAFMLNPQGRFLYDFFITQFNNEILIDCQKSKLQEIIQKFNIYKLRSKVEIAGNPMSYNIYYSNYPLNEQSFKDPRIGDMGYRTITNDSFDETLTKSWYHLMRMNKLIPDADYDFIYNKTFVLEFGGLNLGAVDLKKGCYVGQEVTSRMHYRANIRKKIYLVELLSGSSPTLGEDLIINDKKIGIFLGHSQNLALSLLIIEEVEKLDRVIYDIDNKTIKINR